MHAASSRTARPPEVSMIRLSLPVAFLVPLFAACHFDEWTVDGVQLHAHHEEVLTLDAWPSEGLAVTSHVGDVRAEGHDGPITLTVEVREREPGEAHASIVNGRLVVKAANGVPCAI